MKHPRRFVSATFVLVAAILFLGETIPCLAQQSSTPAASSMAPTPAPPRTERTPFAECLPSGITFDKVVEVIGVVGNKVPPVKITVQQTLSKLGAYCTVGHVLVDGNGKRIAFYQDTGCGGAMPGARAERERREEEKRLDALKQKYDVVEMTCNPSGIPIP